jgi:secreted trypsin-like serine protease
VGGGERRAVDMMVVVEETTLRYGAVGRGTCPGDSGGPALLQDRGAYVVVGVTSYVTSQLCNAQGLDTRTDVDAYRTWIRERLR